MEGWMNQCFLHWCIGPQNNQVKASQFLLLGDVCTHLFKGRKAETQEVVKPGNTHKMGARPFVGSTRLPPRMRIPRHHLDDVTFLSSGNRYKHLCKPSFCGCCYVVGRSNSFKIQVSQLRFGKAGNQQKHAPVGVTWCRDVWVSKQYSNCRMCA